MQDEESNKKYRNDELAIDSDKCVKSVQLIIFVLDHERLKREERSRRYIEAFVKLKR